MDFNEIKNTWKESFKDNEQLSSEQLATITKIKTKSNTALSKIKNSFRFEFYTGIVMYLFIIVCVFILISPPHSIIFFVLVSMLMGTPLIFYYRTYRKIKHAIYTDNTLKQSLQKTTEDIEKFVMSGKHNYLQYITIPTATITGMFMGLFIFSGKNNIIEIFNSLETRSIIMMIVMLSIFSGLMIPIARYYFKKKYKQHYLELRKYLGELEEETIK